MLKNGKYKKLASNAILFAVANLGTKLISFLLVPLYTYTLTKAQYGMVDIILTTLSMLSPIFALSIADAVFRYSMDKDEVSDVITNGCVITCIGGLIAISFTPIFLLAKIPCAPLFSTSLALNLFLNLFQNYARAAGFEKEFAWSGIVSAIIMAVSSVLFLVVIKMGINGYMIGVVLSNACTVLYLFFSTKVWRSIDLHLISTDRLKKYLSYSIPLIPNAFSWWFTNDANRYFILFFVGSAGNGLYAVANKIPSLLNMVYGIFSQAWQMSAVEEYKDKDSNFYSNIMNLSIYVLLFFSCILLSIIKLFMHYFVAPSYYDAWKFVSFLLLAAIFSDISAFLGTIFLAAKETKSIFLTTILGTITNLIFNLILIPIFGVNGAGIGSSLGFMIVSIVRLLLVNRRYIKISLDWKLIIPLTCYLINMLVNFWVSSLIMSTIINSIISLILLLMSFIYIYINRQNYN